MKGMADGLEILARGANRLCARDPEDPRYCLKFELPPDQRTPASLRERLRRWVARTFPYWSDNQTELRASALCRSRYSGDALGEEPRRHGGSYRVGDHFAACHGIVDTRWGPALRCDCVLLPDGSPAPSLHQLLNVGAATAASFFPALPKGGSSPLKRLLQEQVDEFEAFLHATGIPLFDLNAGNFVVVPDGDALRLVCVDAKSIVSGKELVPISRWVPALRRRKIARRAERLRQRITGALTTRPL